jgi:hypothetical protein
MPANPVTVWNCSDLCPFVGSFDAPIIVGGDGIAPMHQGSERQGLADREQFSGSPPSDHAKTKASTYSVRAAHVEFIAVLTAQPPRAIPLDVDAADLEDRADHLNKVLNALSVYVTAILDDTGQNIPGRVDFGDIGAALADLASEITGTIQLAADAMAAGRVV